jgi:hypothetical protein
MVFMALGVLVLMLVPVPVVVVVVVLRGGPCDEHDARADGEDSNDAEQRKHPSSGRRVKSPIHVRLVVRETD